MNYAKHYDLLIERAKTRILPKDVYTEKHHIIPRCMGGSDESQNLVILTAPEHFVAHQLLIKMHPDVIGLVFAAQRMTHISKTKKMIRSNKLYGWIRKLMAGTKTQEHRDKISKGLKGKTKSETHKENLRKARTGKKQSDATKKKNRDSQLGSKFITNEKGHTTKIGKEEILPEGYVYGTRSPSELEKYNKEQEEIQNNKIKPEDFGKAIWEIRKKNKTDKHSRATKDKMSETRQGKKIRANVDETIYMWIHEEHGIEIMCRYDLAEKYKEYGVICDELSKIVKPRYNKITSHKGWRLFGHIVLCALFNTSS